MCHFLQIQKSENLNLMQLTKNSKDIIMKRLYKKIVERGIFMRKKWLALLMTGFLALVLAACGGGSDNESGNGSEDSLDQNIVTIATGGASGPYNIIATTLAD